MKKFSSLLGQSPFGDVHEHMRRTEDCMDRVGRLLEAFLQRDTPRIDALHAEISRLEHEADELKRRIHHELPSRWFLPVDRVDLADFVTAQDGLADAAEDLAVVLTARPTSIPPGLQETIRDLAQEVFAAGRAFFAAASLLRPLMEEFGQGRNVDTIFESLDRVHEHESQSDRVQRRLCKSLLALEGSLGVVEIEYLLRVFTTIDQLANRAEKGADALRALLLRRW